jgi:hypothetical protein
MNGWRRAAPLLLVGALAIAGCGSSGSSHTTTTSKTPTTATAANQKPVSASTLTSSGDKICQEAANAIAAIKLPGFAITDASSPAQLRQAALYYARVVPILGAEVSELRAIGAPTTKAVLFSEFIDNTVSLQSLYTDARLESAAGSARGFAGALQLTSRFAAQARRTAREFGFTVCGRL